MALAFSALVCPGEPGARRLPQPVLLAAGLLALASVALSPPGGACGWVMGLPWRRGWPCRPWGAPWGTARGPASGPTRPLAAVRYPLVRLAGSGDPVRALAVERGVLLFLRGLVRLAFPARAEGDPAAGPAWPRPVPGRVVGLVEATARRRACPTPPWRTAAGTKRRLPCAVPGGGGGAGGAAAGGPGGAARDGDAGRTGGRRGRAGHPRGSSAPGWLTQGHAAEISGKMSPGPC